MKGEAAYAAGAAAVSKNPKGFDMNHWTRRKGLTKTPPTNTSCNIPDIYACRGCCGVVGWSGTVPNIKVTCRGRVTLGLGEVVNDYAPSTANGCEFKRQLNLLPQEQLVGK